MSNSNRFLSDYAYLAEVSYANLSVANNATITKEELKNEVNLGGIESPDSLATLITDNYSVIAYLKMCLYV